VILLVACGPKPGAPAHPADPHDGSTAGSATTGGQTAIAGDSGVPTDAQCDKLITHALDLGAAERPAEQKPTDAERATHQAQLRSTWSPKCKQMTSRGYDCALAAHSLAELERCGG
jgi:hypothetical protein